MSTYLHLVRAHFFLLTTRLYQIISLAHSFFFFSFDIYPATMVIILCILGICFLYLIRQLSFFLSLPLHLP
jgi:uncharacterized membrane protein